MLVVVNTEKLVPVFSRSLEVNRVSAYVKETSGFHTVEVRVESLWCNRYFYLYYIWGFMHFPSRSGASTPSLVASDVKHQTRIDYDFFS